MGFLDRLLGRDRKRRGPDAYDSSTTSPPYTPPSDTVSPAAPILAGSAPEGSAPEGSDPTALADRGPIETAAGDALSGAESADFGGGGDSGGGDSGGGGGDSGGGGNGGGGGGE